MRVPHLLLSEFAALSEEDKVAYERARKAEALRDGRRTAREWKDYWHPGGPCRFGGREWEPPLTQRFCKISEDCYDLWHRGFDRMYKLLGKSCIRNGWA